MKKNQIVEISSLTPGKAISAIQSDIGPLSREIQAPKLAENGPKKSNFKLFKFAL